MSGKKIIVILILFTIFCFLGFSFWETKKEKKENLKEIVVEKEFKISKIKYYSSANAISNTTSFQNPEWNLRVYQYVDIAIYLERINDINSKNYITDVALSHFSKLDNDAIYYLNPTMFGNGILNEEDRIEDSLKYTVINSSNEKEQDYRIPIYFQDFSNPITIRLVRELDKNYKVSNEKSLVYNGKLIEELGLHLSDLASKIIFDIEIDTKDGEKRIQTIELEIPLENEQKSILEGDYEEEVMMNFPF